MMMMMKKKICLFVLAVVALVGRGACQDSPVPSQECIVVGSTIITTCAHEVSVATEYFNVSVGDAEAIGNLKIKPEQLGGLLEEIGEPTQSCCKGTCDFNKNYCGCDKGMVEVINGFIGGNFAFYRTVSEAIANQCGFQVYYEENCPKNKWQKTWKKFAAADCGPYGS